jgi:flagellar hook assembly protein FlgD
MMPGILKTGAAGAAASEKLQAVNTPMVTGGAAETGAYLSEQKDAQSAATSTQFGEIYKQIQSKYGEKPKPTREIKKTLGKDDFLRIMLTQMKNQDPTNPFKAEQMATEIAQFTSVEQLQNVNQNLGKMATQNKPLEQMSMTHLIGRWVTIDRERFPHLEGQSDDLSFNLPRNAESVIVSVESDTGEEVFRSDLRSQKAGSVSFTWDGIKTNTLPAKAGTYRVHVDAKDQAGKSIEINPQVQARVVGVSFEGNEPVFLVGDARHQDHITMKNIVRIDLDQNQSPIKSSTASNPKPNLISFQKGVGSGVMDPNRAAVVESLLGAKNPVGGANVEKGFPNGLRDPDEVRVGNPIESKQEVKKGETMQ